MDFEAVAALDDELLDWRYKGMPPGGEPLRLGDLGAQGWDALGGDLPMPLMLLSEAAVRANIATMAAFCRAQGVLLAPHGKTTMAPQLFARQIQAGCWAMTAATPAHLRVFRRFGVQRILYANQLLDPAAVRWVAGELTRDPAFELICLVDSVAAVRALEAGLGGARVAVMVELGHEGGRTGCRTVAEAVEVARAVAACPCLELIGVETFEGTIHAGSMAATQAAVDALLARCDAALAQLRAGGLLDRRAIVSAGGSAWFDRVLAAFGGRDDVTCVLRSGCYASHDGGFYEDHSPLAGRAAVAGFAEDDSPPGAGLRMGEADASPAGAGPAHAGSEEDAKATSGPSIAPVVSIARRARRLRNALEVWGRVQSRPQPDQAIVSFGKRDVPYDLGLPTPRWWRHATGEVTAIPWAAEVVALSDQHAHLRVDAAAGLAVGDLLGAEISHPCGAFDRWRLVFAVDDARRVTGGVLTFL